MRNRRRSLAANTIAATLCGAACLASAQAGPSIDPWGGRERLVAMYERMPDTELRQFFLRCDRDATQRMLGFVEGVHCALAWDILLKRDFGGNVDMLLEWWRTQREVSAADPMTSKAVTSGEPHVRRSAD